jgi:hypothetical protein
MNAYDQEQLEALVGVKAILADLPSAAKQVLSRRIRNYLRFRQDVDIFLAEYFSQVCTRKCYESRYSACCSREGITTFFADVSINAMVSSQGELDSLSAALREHDSASFKCVYLGKHGCLWRVKPIVCAMFLCQPARKTVFDRHPEAKPLWERLKHREKRYTWPTRPVLFEYLEDFFLERGITSSLMYFHNSPGLLRIKAQRQGRLGARTGVKPDTRS